MRYSLFHFFSRFLLGLVQFHVVEAPERPSSVDLRGALIEKGDKLRELRSLPDGDRTEKYAEELRTTTRQVEALDAEFELTRGVERHALEQAAWDQAVAHLSDNEGRGPDAALDTLERKGYQPIATRVTDSDEYKSFVEGERAGFKFEVRGDMHRELRTLIDSTTTGDGNAGILLPQGQPIPPVARQMRLVVRDLMPVTQTNLSTVPYVRELTPATNETGASSVAEGVAKPEAVMAFEDADAPIRKIAAWVPVTMEILQDAPTLRGYIENRLRYMLAFREQAEILKGNGISPDLEGIYTVTGTQTQAATNNDVPGTIADAISLVELKDGQADGAVMNPGDFWASVSERRSTTFDGDAIGTAPIGAPAPTLWGLPVVRTRALATLECLVADFRGGSMIFDRMSTTIRTSDSHDTFFTLNKVAVLAEERIGVAWFRPDLFVKVTLDITA